MSKKIFVLTILALLLSCNFFGNGKSTYPKIKELELTRSNNIDAWTRIQNSNDFKNFKLPFVNSIGKTRNSELIPLISNIILESKDDSLSSECLFALGQMNSGTAEQLLLNLPFENYSKSVQKSLIYALGHCATPKTVDFFEQHLNDLDLNPIILSNAAICARKSLSVSGIKNHVVDSTSLENPTKELAYFLYNSAKQGDIPGLIKLISSSDGLTQKYALKKLSNLYSKNKNQIKTLINKDSLSYSDLRNSIFNILKRKSAWNNKFYALQVSPIVADSVLVDLIEASVSSKNIHIKLTALHSLAETEQGRALSAILIALGNEANWFIKGSLIKMLAEYYPNKAYPFIMQNLDRGDRLFKAKLLDALAMLKMPLANRTLKQFLNVDDPLLVNTSFENLKTKRMISDDDISVLLNSDYFSTVATVIEYQTEKKKRIPKNQLLKLFKKYRSPSEFEVQFAILNAIKLHDVQPESGFLLDLFQSASHEVVRKRISINFPSFAAQENISLKPNIGSAAFLHPDSILYFDNNPIVEVVTDKGNIVIELFAQNTPFTVYSFLKLLDMSFYNDLIFHRVVPDFVIQGGDPLGDGWGGPNFLLPSEDNQLSFKRGSVGIATSGFDTGSSQFFICQSEQPHLDGNYTLFGKVTSGMDVVDSILPGDKIITIQKKLD